MNWYIPCSKISIPFRQVFWRHTAIAFLSFITLSNKFVLVIVLSPCTQYSSWYFFFRITILSPLFARHRGTVEIQSPILQWVENCEACKSQSPLEWSTPSSFVSSSSCSSSTLVALGVVAHLFCMRDFRSPPHLSYLVTYKGTLDWMVEYFLSVIFTYLYLFILFILYFYFSDWFVGGLLVLYPLEMNSWTFDNIDV